MLNLHQFEYIVLDGDVHFIFLDRGDPFLVNFVQQYKIVCLG